MTNKDLLQAMGNIDPKLIAEAAPDLIKDKNADNEWQRSEKGISAGTSSSRKFPWKTIIASAACAAAVLFGVFIMKNFIPANSVIDPNGSNTDPNGFGFADSSKVNYEPVKLDQPTFSTPNELVDAADIVILGKVMGISFDVFDMTTGKNPTEKSDPNNCILYTVYDIDVRISYKGNSTDKIKLVVPGGYKDNYIDKQLEVLEKYSKNTDVIPLLYYLPTIETDKKYLFALEQTGDNSPTIINENWSVYPIKYSFDKNVYSYVTYKNIISCFGEEKWNKSLPEIAEELGLTSEQLNQLEELRKKAGPLESYPYDEAVILGEIDPNAPKLDLETAKKIIAECDSFEEILSEFEKVQKYPDYSYSFSGRYGAVAEYRLNGSESEKIIIIDESSDSYHVKTVKVEIIYSSYNPDGSLKYSEELYSEEMSEDKFNVEYNEPILVDWVTFNDINELLDEADLVVLGKVVGVSFRAIDTTTGKTPTEASHPGNLYLYTVYEIDVQTTYKGSSSGIIRLEVMGGLKDNFIQEQLNELNKYAKDTNVIPLLAGAPTIEQSETYLFVLGQSIYDNDLTSILNIYQSVYPVRKPLEKISPYSIKDIIHYFGKKDMWIEFLYECANEIGLTVEQIELLDKLDGVGISHPYQEAVIFGEIDPNAPKLDLATVKDIIARFDNFDEIWSEIIKVQEYPDYIYGSGIVRIVYYLDELAREQITIIPFFNGGNIYYESFNSDGELIFSERLF